MQMIFILKLFQEQSKANRAAEEANRAAEEAKRAAEEAKRAAVIALPFGASNKQKSTQSWQISGSGHLDSQLPLRPEGR